VRDEAGDALSITGMPGWFTHDSLGAE